MGTHAKAECTINAPIHEVWDVLTDFDNGKGWNEVYTVKTSDFNAGCKLTLKSIALNGAIRLNVKFYRVEKPGPMSQSAFMGWGNNTALSRFVLHANHYFDLRKIDDNTTLLIHGEIFNGLMGPLVKFGLDKVNEVYEGMNQSLKAYVESRVIEAEAS